MTALATITATSALPALLHPDLDLALRQATNAATWSGERGVVKAEDAPSPEVLDGLRTRRAELAPWLHPAALEGIRNEVAILFTQLEHFTPVEMLTAKMELFAQDVLGVPRWALERACRAYRQGDLGDGHRLPTAGDVRQAALRYSLDYDREARRIDKVLALTIAAAPSAPSRKAELIAAAKALGNSMAMQTAAETARRAGRDVVPEEIPDHALAPAARQQRAEERLQTLAQKVASEPTPQIGPALRKRLQEQGALRPLPPAPAEVDQGADWRGEVA